MSDTVQQDLVDCPYCAEHIKKSAKKCRHCGEIVDPQMREIEALKKEKSSPSVFMNAGGGASAAASAATTATSSGGTGLVPFRHGLHILVSVLSMGMWLPVYILLYLFRNKTVYR